MDKQLPSTGFDNAKHMADCIAVLFFLQSSGPGGFQV